MGASILHVRKIKSESISASATQPPGASAPGVQFIQTCQSSKFALTWKDHFHAGFPIIPISIYALIRALFHDANCWLTPIEQYEWVLNTPCLSSLVVGNLIITSTFYKSYYHLQHLDTSDNVVRFTVRVPITYSLNTLNVQIYRWICMFMAECVICRRMCTHL